MHVIKEDLIINLKRFQKKLEDINYVSYALYEKENILVKHYYCTIHEFLDATKMATCPFDISFMCHICFVGDEWWLNYNYQGNLEMHMPPIQPIGYRIPSQSELVLIEK